jgi:2-haloalkanoic acid dehalogenase type II
MTRPRVLTFDCYGTLIDWNGGISSALIAEGERQGFAVDRDVILHAYHAAEPRVQGDEYRSYREVLTLLETEIAAELGWEPPADGGYLAASLGGWQPFADTNRALERLVSMGFELGILSNIDDDLLAASRSHFTVEFGLIVTAQQVHSYKPAAAHFHRALAAVGGDHAAMLHIAQSYFHDIRPATQMGFETLWVNRLSEPVPSGGPSPAGDVGDLDAAVAWVERRHGDQAVRGESLKGPLHG